MFRGPFYETLSVCKNAAPGTHKFRFTNTVLSLNSTTISLCFSLFPGPSSDVPKGPWSFTFFRIMMDTCPPMPPYRTGKDMMWPSPERYLSLQAFRWLWIMDTTISQAFRVLEREGNILCDPIEGKRRLYRRQRSDPSKEHYYPLWSTYPLYRVLCPETLPVSPSKGRGVEHITRAGTGPAHQPSLIWYNHHIGDLQGPAADRAILQGLEANPESLYTDVDSIFQ